MDRRSMLTVRRPLHILQEAYPSITLTLVLGKPRCDNRLKALARKE